MDEEKTNQCLADNEVIMLLMYTIIIYLVDIMHILLCTLHIVKELMRVVTWWYVCELDI